jgi:hypothetical protein
VLYKKLYPFTKPYARRALLAFLVTLPVGTLDAAIAALLKPYTIVVLDQGVIAETGTHESLFANPNGIYRSLYDNQFQRIGINP